MQACAPPLGYVAAAGDCIDSNPAVHPGASEVCNLMDDNCEGGVDEGCPVQTYYRDTDGDGVGSAAAPLESTLPAPPPGYAAAATDCDDGDPLVFPGATERCNGRDDSCDGTADEGCLASLSLAPATLALNGFVPTAQLHVTGLLVGGGSADLTPASSGTTYLSDHPETAPVSAEGIVSAVATGTARVTASNGAFSTSCDVTVALRPPDYVPQPPGSFGASYEDLVPPTATVVTYDPKRFSVATGEVRDREGSPLVGVQVSVVGRPEYGNTLTDAEGRFSLPVEGGIAVVLDYTKTGYLPSQRPVEVPLNDIARADPVTLITADPVSTAVTFNGSAQTVVTHRGTPVSDADGTRAATVVFTGDNRAWSASGTELTTLTVRTTEYPTPEAMPAALPPTSAFTWCAEFTADEANDVHFEKPVAVYVENFLGFAVGGQVPVGTYDRSRAVWVPQQNARVVRLLDTDADGVTDALDATGDGAADDLDGNGSVGNESAGLGDPVRYPPGATFWRALFPHFSTGDINAGSQVPAEGYDAVPKAAVSTDLVAGRGKGKPTRCPVPGVTDTTPSNSTNSFVTHLDRVYHEDVPLPGTPWTLHYASSRAPGYLTRITVPVSNPVVPVSLESIRVQVDVAGRRFERSLPADPGQVAEFDWDGLDHLGRPVSGSQTARVAVGYRFRGSYALPGPGQDPAFGQPGQIDSGVFTRDPSLLWVKSTLLVYRPPQGDLGVGWQLANRHHLGTGASGVLFRGTGELTSPAVGDLLRRLPLPVLQYTDHPPRVVPASDGTLYVGDRNGFRVWRVAPGGTTTLFAGNGTHGSDGNHGNGGPATAAALGYIEQMVLDESEGRHRLTLAIPDLHVVRRVDGATGLITTVAGTGEQADEGHACSGGRSDPCDSGPATQAHLNVPVGVALDGHGGLYISEDYGKRIRRVDPAGIITTHAGTGPDQYGFWTDGELAVDSALACPGDLAVGGDGTVYLADECARRLRRIDAGGILTSAVGDGTCGEPVDGAPAAGSRVCGVQTVAVDRTGNVYFADTAYPRVWKIDTAGRMRTVAGTGQPGDPQDGTPAVTASIHYPMNVAVDAAENVWFTSGESIYQMVKDPFREKVLAAVTGGSGDPDLVAADEEGVYVFDATGRHLRTVDPATGVSLVIFGHDAAQRLTSVADRFGNTTTLERDAAGTPLAVVAPDGQRTELTLDGNGHLRAVLYADQTGYDFTYTPEGLLKDETDPRRSVFRHDYEATTGRVTDVFDPEGGHWHYGRTAHPDAVVSTFSTNEGNTTTYTQRTGLVYTQHTELLADAFNSGDGASTLVTTTPYESSSTYTQSGTGLSSISETPCGMVVATSYGLEPRFGFLTERSSTTVLLSGLARVTGTTRTYEDADRDGAAEVVVDQTTVNGKTWTTTNALLTGGVAAVTPEGRTTTLTYDPANLLPAELSMPGLLPASFGYDARGRLTSATVGTRTAQLLYDANGNPDYTLTSDGKVIEYTYDVMGRLREEIRPGDNLHHAVGNYDAARGDVRTRYDYDANGNLWRLWVPQPGGAETLHAFSATANDQRKLYATPLSGSYQYLYDTERKLKTVTFPSQKLITNTYVDGLLDHTDLPPGEGTITYSHDCAGRIDGATKGTESVTLAHDGALLTSDTRSGLLNQTLGYGYDADFNLTAFSCAGGTEILNYDDDGLLTQSGPFTITRNPQNGLPETVTDGTLTQTRTFSGYGELDGVSYAVNGTAVYSWAVTERDLAGRIKKRDEVVEGNPIHWEYGYDALGRLTDVWKDSVLTEHYEYDPNGNRTLETSTARGVVDRVCTHTTEDQLLTCGPAGSQEVWSFDVDGFLTGRQTPGSPTPAVTSYDYSSRGELRFVDLADNTTVTYDHDPVGRRIAKRVNGAVVEKYLWQGINTKLLAVYNPDDSLKIRFLYGDDRLPVSMIYNGATYYLLTDQVGTLRAVADTAGTIVKRIDYDTFGNVLSDSDPTFPMPLGFAGGLQDRDAGLVRFGFRDFEPNTGRWVAKDPIDFAAGDSNLFGYVGRDPTNKHDPLGLAGNARGTLGSIADKVACADTIPLGLAGPPGQIVGQILDIASWGLTTAILAVDALNGDISVKQAIAAELVNTANLGVGTLGNVLGGSGAMGISAAETLLLSLQNRITSGGASTNPYPGLFK